MQLKFTIILLLWMHSITLLLNLVTAAEESDVTIQSSTAVLNSNSSQLLNEKRHIDAVNTDADTEVVEAQVVPLENDVTQTSSHRQDRQFFFHPAIGFLPSYTGANNKCITTQGLSGVCVSFDSCHQYVRFRRQLMFIPVRQWPAIASRNQEFCTFYDAYGRANNGICCTNQLDNGAFGFGLLPVQPMRPPVTVPVPRPPAQQPAVPETPEAGDEDNDNDVTEDEESGETQDNNNNNNDSEEVAAPEPDKDEDGNGEQSSAEAGNEPAENSPDFPDISNVAYDPIHEEDVEMPTPVTYDDYRYQWPTQQFGGVSQAWPPTLPTHPPTTAASWPPPIPTHPPGHHYPTHPPAQTRPTSSSSSTKKTTITTTTSRRPSTTPRPSYPNYPVYPSYPHYPSYRPTTPRPRPTTTTTRKPTTASGVSAHGLPLECGVKNPVSPDQERIVGGSNASPNEFPWIAVLFKAGKQFCGGSLITNSHILTAAHCVARMTSWDVASLTAHLGDYDIRSSFETKHVERRIKRLVRHKGFDFSTLHNDIAILTIHEPVKFNYEIQPICLPTSTEQLSRSYSGKLATVAGWGSLRENGPQPSVLQKVDIPIWTNSECARKYGSAAPGGIISSMICAGRAARDSCSGDSGGPMIINEGGRYTQVGIVSWGIGCGKGQYPGVYTRVTSLLPWIYKNIKG